MNRICKSFLTQVCKSFLTQISKSFLTQICKSFLIQVCKSFLIQSNVVQMTFRSRHIPGNGSRMRTQRGICILQQRRGGHGVELHWLLFCTSCSKIHNCVKIPISHEQLSWMTSQQERNLNICDHIQIQRGICILQLRRRGHEVELHWLQFCTSCSNIPISHEQLSLMVHGNCQSDRHHNRQPRSQRRGMRKLEQQTWSCSCFLFLLQINISLLTQAFIYGLLNLLKIFSYSQYLRPAIISFQKTRGFLTIQLALYSCNFHYIKFQLVESLSKIRFIKKINQQIYLQKRSTEKSQSNQLREG